MQINEIKYLSSDEESIIACCTPTGSGAIAILRLCGVDAILIADKISKLSSGKKLLSLPTHTIHHGYIPVVDEVLFLLMRAPKTFTGQDTVEINCHNNPFIIEKIIALAIKNGARLASRGEFSKRAFLNNKIDLIQAESINEIICAQNELTLKKSMSQLSGTLSSFLKDLESLLIELLSIIEAGFEFLEEEQRDIDLQNLIKNKADSFLQKLKGIKKDFGLQQQIRDGIKIAIIGEVNVGKSTLFNSLLNKNRSIVTDIAGTTRDSVESALYRDGNFWQLTDTAGLRKTNDKIEKYGIERSLQEAARSDIVLFVLDSTKELKKDNLRDCRDILKQYKNKVILVFNKIDKTEIDKKNFLEELDFMREIDFVSVSAKEKIGIEILEKLIKQRINKIFQRLDSPFLLNKRQFNLIVQLEKKFNFIVSSMSAGLQYELIAHHLKEIFENLSELTGKNVTEKVLDNIFDSFCIGK